MIIEDKELESIVWTDHRFGLSAVHIGKLKVTNYIRHEKAADIVADIRSEVIKTLKLKIVEMAKTHCGRCHKGMPVKKMKTDFGIRLLHKDPSIGWQMCDAEFIWMAVLEDTQERAEAEGQQIPAEMRLWKPGEIRL